MNALFSLENMTHLRFKGPDAERYLNGQVTQQVSQLPIGHSRSAFVCDAKGRILFDATIHNDGEGLLFSVAGAPTDEVFARMDRYLIADDCEIQDESDRWTLVHETGVEATDGLVNRFGLPGQDRYLTNEQSVQPTHSQEAAEHLRITAGIPHFPDFVGALPAETGWEEKAVSYHKGCYLGQEVISRMKRAGRTNRTLVSATISAQPKSLPLTFTAPDNDKVLFEVTSISPEKTAEGFPVLGYRSSKVTAETELVSAQGITVSFH